MSDQDPSNKDVKPEAPEVKPEAPEVKPENAIPYARFKEVNDQRKALEDKLKEREDADKKSADAKLIEEKKFDELLKQREAELATRRSEIASLQEKAKAYEEEQTALREQALAKIQDESLRTIAAKLPSTADIIAFGERTAPKPGPSDAKGRPVGPENPLKAKPGESFSDWQRRTQKIS